MNHWVIWAIKLVLGLVATVGTVYVVSFGVADYVVKANTAGLQNSIDNLNSNLANFNNNLTAANSLLSQQLLDLRKEKEGLAVSIAQEVAKLQLDQGLHSAPKRQGRYGGGL